MNRAHIRKQKAVYYYMDILVYLADGAHAVPEEVVPLGPASRRRVVRIPSAIGWASLRRHVHDVGDQILHRALEHWHWTQLVWERLFLE